MSDVVSHWWRRCVNFLECKHSDKFMHRHHHTSCHFSSVHKTGKTALTQKTKTQENPSGIQWAPGHPACTDGQAFSFVFRFLHWAVYSMCKLWSFTEPKNIEKMFGSFLLYICRQDAKWFALKTIYKKYHAASEPLCPHQTAVVFPSPLWGRQRGGLN